MNLKTDDGMLYSVARRLRGLEPKPEIVYCVSGHEFFFRYLIKAGFCVIHLDNDPNTVCQEAEFCPGAKHLCFDVEQWNFDLIPENSVEALVFARSLHHMSNPLQALQNAVLALKTGGIFLVVDFHSEHIADKLMRQQIAMSSGFGFMGGETYHLMQMDYQHLDELGLVDRDDLVKLFQTAGMDGFRLYSNREYYSLCWRKHTKL